MWKKSILCLTVFQKYSTDLPLSGEPTYVEHSDSSFVCLLPPVYVQHVDYKPFFTTDACLADTASMD